MKYAYELENVSFSYGGRKLLQNLSLRIPQGSICAVMGPNGSGKTTLLHLLLGWLKPDQGSVRVCGRSLSSLSPRERGRMLSLLPQMENLGFDYTVMEYILLGRAPHLHPLQQPQKSDRETALDSLSEVGGERLAIRKIPTLSGGETQTMLMARSLTQQPRVLLLDEPANHLDPARRRRMLDIISELRSRNRTVVFTTHNPEAAAGVADHLILMPEDGQAECGSFGSLFTEERLSRLYGVPVRIIRLDGGGLTVHY